MVRVDMSHLAAIVILLVVACASTRESRAYTPYILYIPMAAAPHPQPQGLKGLAMADPSHTEDLDALDTSWWYWWGWSTSEPGVVPMVREMQMPPTCEPYVLVGNEPDSIEPYGHPVAPADAAQRVLAMEAMCPESKLIVGNVTQDGGEWLTEFLEKYQFVTGASYTGGLGVHCYQWQAGVCIERLSILRQLYNGEMWVTEFNDFSGSGVEFRRLLDYIALNFDRYAVFTNRQTMGPGFPLGHIVNPDGSLTERGLIYSEK